jgi:hypothetical protein
MGGVVDFVSGAIHSVGEATGINNVVDAVYNPVSNAVTSVSDAIGIKEVLDDTVDSVGDFARDNPVLAGAALAAGGYLAYPWLSSAFTTGMNSLGSALGLTSTTTLTLADEAALAAQGLLSQGYAPEVAAQMLVQAGMAGDVALSGVTSAMAGTVPSFTAGGVAGALQTAGSVLGAVGGNVGSAVTQSLTNPSGTGWAGVLGGVANTAGNLFIQQQALDFSKQQAETARQTGLLGQQQLNQLSQQVQNQSQFKPYGITSNLGSANVDASGNTSLGMSQQTQQLQNQLTNNALGVTAQNPMVSQQGLFTAMQDVNSAENQRNRLALESRLAAQGRLGTGTSMFGGASPEMYAIEAAQQQQTANNYLASMQQAGSLTGQNLTNQQYATANMLAPQQGLLNLASTNATTGGQFNTATQNQAKIAAELGLSGVNTMMQGVTNANDINAAGQANQLGMLNSLVGSTPQYNQQGQVTGYNNNAANTIGGLFNLGSSVYNGVKSIF